MPTVFALCVFWGEEAGGFPQPEIKMHANIEKPSLRKFVFISIFAPHVICNHLHLQGVSRYLHLIIPHQSRCVSRSMFVNPMQFLDRFVNADAVLRHQPPHHCDAIRKFYAFSNATCTAHAGLIIDPEEMKSARASSVVLGRLRASRITMF